MTRIELLDAAYGGLERVLESLGDADLLRPTRCTGWTVADVTYHLLLDAQRALVAFGTDPAEPPDVDEVSYWSPFKPGLDGADDHGRFIRLSTAAHASPRVVVHRYVEAATAVRRVAARTDPDRVIETQRHRLTVASFLSTLVVEAAVHHLDLVVDLPTASSPADAVLDHVRTVLDAMNDEPAPADVPDTDYVLAATGRLPLDDSVRARFGPAADRFPLLG
jgi:uncharacterized protein (TIGR03083 family)